MKGTPSEVNEVVTVVVCVVGSLAPSILVLVFPVSGLVTSALYPLVLVLVSTCRSW